MDFDRFYLKTLDMRLYADPVTRSSSAQKPPTREEVAFNRGCDDRLAGKSKAVNPYLTKLFASAREVRYWNEGWEEVQRSWGRNVRGRWAYEPLSKRDA